MAARVHFIDTDGADVITSYRKVVGRAPAAPGRHVITDARQLELLEAEERLAFLKWDGAEVVERTNAEKRAIVQAESDSVAANEATSIDSEAFRDLVNQRLAALGQPQITEAEEAAQRKAIRDGRMP